MKKEMTYRIMSDTIMPGFYNSILLHEEMFSDMILYFYRKYFPDRDLDDVRGYMDDVCKAMVERLLEPMLTSDKRICNKAEFKEVVSCSDYSRGNDRLVLTINADAKYLAGWIAENSAEGFDEYLGYRWSSHDGFVSRVPDNIDDYMESGVEDYPGVMFDYYILTKIYNDNHVVSHIEDEESTDYYSQMYEIATEVLTRYLG